MTLALAMSALLACARPAGAAFTEGARLSAVYDLVLGARFEQVEPALQAACPPAPVEACKALRVASLWWQVLLDPDDRSLDGRLNQLASDAIASSDAWTRREPRRGEAWFYLAGSYAPLVQWRVTRGERLAAARDGNRIREALERALALDPSLTDAYFGIGLYHYYADVAPAAAKLLRWLLLLPGGDRVRGLREMLQAEAGAQMLKGEAEYQLHLVYLWYEQQPGKALALLDGLDRRHPANPVFLQRIAEVQDVYLHDHVSSARAWEALLERARAAGVARPALAETRARLGLAGQLDALDESDRAIDLLAPVVDAKPAAPYGATAEAELRLAIACDRLGQRARARALFTAAAAHAPADDPKDIRGRAAAAARRPAEPRHADAYRLALEGWRALATGRVGDARSALARAADLDPDNPVTRYRYASALLQAGDRAAAAAELDRTLAAQPPAPAFVRASACADAARLAEARGDRARARALFESAAEIVGGDPRVREQAARDARRLGSTRVSRHQNF